MNEVCMPAQHAIDELVGILRERAQRYQALAEGLYDLRTAAEVAACADELEAEAARLETLRWSFRAMRLEISCR
jgi:hypothetical protein